MTECKHDNTVAASAISSAPVWCPDCSKWVVLVEKFRHYHNNKDDTVKPGVADNHELRYKRNAPRT